MGIILDTSFLAAFVNAKDANHGNAEALKSRIENREFGQAYISDYIFDEFVTLLKARGIPTARIAEAGDALLADESIRMLKADMQVFLEAWGLFKGSDRLSFTDCTTVQLAEQFGLKNVASYDSDLDRRVLHRRE